MYGWQTKSWRNSTEHRQQKAENAAFTEKFERGEVKLPSARMPVLCHCIARQFPHEPAVHDDILAWDGDWRGFWKAENRKLWKPPQHVEVGRAG